MDFFLSKQQPQKKKKLNWSIINTKQAKNEKKPKIFKQKEKKTIKNKKWIMKKKIPVKDNNNI